MTKSESKILLKVPSKILSQTLPTDLFLSTIKPHVLSKALWLALVLGVVGFCLSEPAWAQFVGSGFENRMKGLTNQLMTVVLPLMSVLGLVYAVILALIGDGAAKGRIIMVIVCSIVGFLAPHIISWFQSAVGH